MFYCVGDEVVYTTYVTQKQKKTKKTKKKDIISRRYSCRNTVFVKEYYNYILEEIRLETEIYVIDKLYLEKEKQEEERIRLEFLIYKKYEKAWSDEELRIIKADDRWKRLQYNKCATYNRDI